MSTNKRVHPRYRFVRRVNLLIEGDRLIDAETFDISAGGSSVICSQPLVTGSVCQIGFIMWDNGLPQTFAVSAVVRHVVFALDGGYRVGLQFSNVPDSSRRALLRLLARLANPDADAQKELVAQPQHPDRVT